MTQRFDPARSIYLERIEERAKQQAAHAQSPAAKNERLLVNAKRHTTVARVRASCTEDKWQDIEALIADREFLSRLGLTQADVQNGHAYEVLLRYVCSRVEE